MNDILNEGLSLWNIPFQSKQIEQLLFYAEKLIAKNRVMNLTAITEPDQIARLHFLDSLSLLTVPDIDFHGKKLLDLGTGAGFPAVPLAIFLPQTEIWAMDSTGKKITFLEDFAQEAELTNLHFLCGRAEEFAHSPEYRSTFDFVTARAVTLLPILLELSVPFMKTGGILMSMKSNNIPAELHSGITASKVLKSRFLSAYPYTIPHTEVSRQILLFEKKGATEDQYPRKYARILKSPLGESISQEGL